MKRISKITVYDDITVGDVANGVGFVASGYLAFAMVFCAR